MPPTSQTDGLRPRRQPLLSGRYGALALVSLALALGLTACDGDDPAADAGADAGPLFDGSPMSDAAPGADTGPIEPFIDAAPPEDAGPMEFDCLEPEGADPSGTSVWDDPPNGRAEVAVEARGECLQRYVLGTTAELRHGLPENPRTIRERESWPTTRTGHDLFDALHALAMEETRECSVSAVRDYAFNDGEAVPCGEGGCFETGRLWNYVWTRDTAYAVDLGLAWLDPTRSRNSLEFKLSERRGGGNEQIVQDTGTGGSYPVSSDRVSWAMGAAELLHHLDGAERTAFRDRTYRALVNTVEHDRVVVFDPADGLYFGEQSFLDWREQTYPEWTAGDVTPIATSKALGTNLLHLQALELTATLAAERGEASAEARYRGFADGLRAAIRTRLWVEEDGLFSTYQTTFLDPAPVRRYDLLASAFAVLLGVADEAQAASILERYPHYGPGAPVVWPQQQLTPIYHNRGEWPFVTAYWLRAAKVADNDAVVDRMVRALIRGAAINLSNMENFDAETGAAWEDDGDFSGPVVNSQRQLWSVAGYVSMVHHTLFGLEAEAGGLAIRPYITRGLRNDLFAGTDRLVLNGYRWRGRQITVALDLPPVGGRGGSYRVGAIRVDGEVFTGEHLVAADLRAHSVVEVELLDEGEREPSPITLADASDWREIFGPRTPRITAVGIEGGRVRLTLSKNGETEEVRFAVYRDGERLADGLADSTVSFVDEASDTGAPVSPCYVVETCFASSGNCSQHSPPMCFWGEGNAAIFEIGASAFTHVGGIRSFEHGREHIGSWGDPGHEIELASFTAARTGEHLLQVLFGNGAGSIPTGITCAVKRLTVEDVETDAIVGNGFLVMPHLGPGDWARWENSTFVRADLVSGRAYRVRITGDEEATNMSAFAHFEAYTGGLGGASGFYNRANVAVLKILAR